MILIALNTFKEIIRNRFLTLVFFFGILFTLFSLILSNLAIGEENKMILDFGISMIEIFWLIGVVFIGSQLVLKEIEWKTIFLILSKPIERYEFVLGKFLWFSGVIACLVFGQSLLYIGILLFSSIPLEWIILLSLWFVFLKFLLLLTILLFLSMFLSPILTLICGILIYFVGHTLTDFVNMMTKIHEWLGMFANGIAVFFPPLETLNTKNLIGITSYTFGEYFLLVTHIYAFLYIAAVLFWAIIFFEKKEFE